MTSKATPSRYEQPLPDDRPAAAKQRRRSVIRMTMMIVACVALAGGVLTGIVEGETPWVWLIITMLLMVTIVVVRQTLADLGLLKSRQDAVQRIAGAVTVDDREIVYAHRMYGTQRVSWQDLRRVLIRAWDMRPVGSVYCVLSTNGDECLIPIDAVGVETLLEAMRERLPGFDGDAASRAMALPDGTVEVWRKS